MRLHLKGGMSVSLPTIHGTITSTPERKSRLTPQFNATQCRLCKSPTEFVFQKTILESFPASYYRCLTCGSLQTEQPWWLPLAYGHDAERFDTGKATRSLRNFFSLPSLLEILGISHDTPLVDWGGGGGLVSRLMRDIGYECYCYDRHLSSEYMTGFQWSAAKHGSRPAITLFEVAEHFENPWEEWKQLFQLQPPLIFGSTEIFANQPADWPYLSPENGQHVFFYSAKALGWLAKQFGYSAALIGPYFIFTPERLHADTCRKITQWLTNQDVGQLEVFHQWRSTRYANSIKDQRSLRKASAIPASSRKVLIDLIFFSITAPASRDCGTHFCDAGSKLALQNTLC